MLYFHEVRPYLASILFFWSRRDIVISTRKTILAHTNYHILAISLNFQIICIFRSSTKAKSWRILSLSEFCELKPSTWMLGTMRTSDTVFLMVRNEFRSSEFVIHYICRQIRFIFLSSKFYDKCGSQIYNIKKKTIIPRKWRQRIRNQKQWRDLVDSRVGQGNEGRVQTGSCGRG